MHKISILVLLLVASTLTNAQIVQKKTYYRDRRTVETSFYFDNGTGQKHGIYKEFSPLGGVIVEGKYNQGKKVGKWEYKLPTNLKTITIESYNQQGQLHGDFIGVPNGYHDLTPSMGKYINGKKEGIWKEFIVRDDKMYITSISHWEKGLRTGDYVEYYPNGLVKFKARYEQGEYNDDGIWGIPVDTSFYYNNSSQEPKLQKIEVYKYGKRIYSEEFATAVDILENRKEQITRKFRRDADLPDSMPKRKRISYGDDDFKPYEFSTGEREIQIALLYRLANVDGKIDADEEKWLINILRANNPRYYDSEIVRYTDMIKSRSAPASSGNLSTIKDKRVANDILNNLINLAAMDGEISAAEEKAIESFAVGK